MVLGPRVRCPLRTRSASLQSALLILWSLCLLLLLLPLFGWSVICPLLPVESVLHRYRLLQLLPGIASPVGSSQTSSCLLVNVFFPSRAPVCHREHHGAGYRTMVETNEKRLNETQVEMRCTCSCEFIQNPKLLQVVMSGRGRTNILHTGPDRTGKH